MSYTQKVCIGLFHFMNIETQEKQVYADRHTHMPAMDKGSRITVPQLSESPFSKPKCRAFPQKELVGNILAYPTKEVLLVDTNLSLVD